MSISLQNPKSSHLVSQYHFMTRDAARCTERYSYRTLLAQISVHFDLIFSSHLRYHIKHASDFPGTLATNSSLLALTPVH